MFKALAPGLLIFSLLLFVSANDNGYPSHCNCYEEGLFSVQNILECQRVSDFLIAVAYFSIPVELLYFLSCSNVPFKWVLLQFVAFIVLCGLTHLLNWWADYGSQSFQLMLALTVAKFLTALVSCATAITLLTLIPLLLKVKVRELFLRQNVLELGQEVGMMKRQKEASWHVRMLTQEIRKSLDKHTILYTTLVELSKTLDLQSCAVWMPNRDNTEMSLTHVLESSSVEAKYGCSIPISDPDVLDIKKSKGVRILRPGSALGAASSGRISESGAVAAIRMPKLCVSNFKGGTPELVETCYAILVLVLPSVRYRVWSYAEMEIVEVVADQVAVALSHAAVLEESQLMRDKLREQNCTLQQAKKNALMASKARNSFQKVMSYGMRRPMHSVLGFLSIFQEEGVSFDQRIIVDTMVKSGSVLSTLVNDMMESPAKENGRLPPEMRPFQLHSFIREALCLVKCFCVCKGFGFSVNVLNSLPNHVMGDEKRAFQVILHMVGYLLDRSQEVGSVKFSVLLDSGSGGKDDTVRGKWGQSMADGYVPIRFEIEITHKASESETSISAMNYSGRRGFNSSEFKEGLSFGLCRKLVKMMQGNIWISSNSGTQTHSMTLILRFHIQPSPERALFEPVYVLVQPNSNLLFQGVRAIIADDDDVNRTVTKKLLEKLGCHVSAVSSGSECLSYLGLPGTCFQVVMLDLHMPEMDGFEAAARIRKLRIQNQPSVIALTATAEENAWERCLQNGMNGLIRKPVLLRGLADELQRVMRGGSEGGVV